MEADSWSARLSSASKRYQSALQLQSEMLMGFEEIDGDDEVREEFTCPFCAEYYDIVGLCCHIDEEHPVEAKNGMTDLRKNATCLGIARVSRSVGQNKVVEDVCPVCAMRVGVDMVVHITLQHGNIFKMHRKRKSRKGGSQATLSLLRKELREGNLQSLFGASSLTAPSSNAAPDPLLTSFIMPVAEDHVSVQPHLAESSSTKKSLNDSASERKSEESCSMSVEDKEEKTKRSEFVQGLLLSSIFNQHF